MERQRDLALTAIISIVGALILLALTVFPFQYGWAESSLLAGAFVVVALFEMVLDDAVSSG